MAVGLNTKKDVKSGLLTFHSGAIESEGIMGFIKKRKTRNMIQISQISQVSHGVVSRSLVWLIAGAFFLFSGIGVWSTIKPMSVLFILLGLGCGYMFFFMKRYGLIIELSSGGGYSYLTPEEAYIIRAYDLILEIINTKEENRVTGGTFNFINGTFNGSAIGNQAKSTTYNYPNRAVENTDYQQEYYQNTDYYQEDDYQDRNYQNQGSGYYNNQNQASAYSGQRRQNNTTARRR